MNSFEGFSEKNHLKKKIYRSLKDGTTNDKGKKLDVT